MTYLFMKWHKIRHYAGYLQNLALQRLPKLDLLLYCIRPQSHPKRKKKLVQLMADWQQHRIKLLLRPLLLQRGSGQTSWPHIKILNKKNNIRICTEDKSALTLAQAFELHAQGAEV